MTCMVSAYDVASYITDKDLTLSKQILLLNELYQKYRHLLINADRDNRKAFEMRVHQYLYLSKEENDCLLALEDGKTVGYNERNDHPDYFFLKKIVLAMIAEQRYITICTKKDFLHLCAKKRITQKWLDNFVSFCYNCKLTVTELGSRIILNEVMFKELKYDKWIQLEIFSSY